MNKEFLKMAMIGIAAGACLSAQIEPAKTSKEIAMSKCSKDGHSDDGSCGSCGNGKKDDSSCSGDSGCGSGSDDKTSSSKEVEVKRRSAAKKVLEGS